MFESTEFGVAFTKMSLVRKVAETVGIPQADFMTPAEIRAELAQHDPETSQLLQAFLDAFDRWFAVARMIESGYGRTAKVDEESDSVYQERRRRQDELQTRLMGLKRT